MRRLPGTSKIHSGLSTKNDKPARISIAPSLSVSNSNETDSMIRGQRGHFRFWKLLTIYRQNC